MTTQVAGYLMMHPLGTPIWQLISLWGI